MGRLPWVCRNTVTVVALDWSWRMENVRFDLCMSCIVAVVSRFIYAPFAVAFACV